jgi:hypothetical protein
LIGGAWATPYYRAMTEQLSPYRQSNNNPEKHRFIKNGANPHFHVVLWIIIHVFDNILPCVNMSVHINVVEKQNQPKLIG